MNVHELPRPFYVLAPMDDVTDSVFRRVVADCAAPDVFFTEFANVDGLQSPGRPRLLKKLRFAESETRLVAQLWGLNPENFETTARQIADGSFARESGLPDGCNFVGVDLNMGCPAKSEVQNGACSALIKNRPLAHDIIEATRRGLGGTLPLSVKTRLGFHEIDLSWIEFLLGHNLDMLTIHGRTRSEMSKVPAHWDVIGQCGQLRSKLAPDTLIVGNGDVSDRPHGAQLAAQYGLDGIMIGRGIFTNPLAFSEQPTDDWSSYDKSDRIALYRRHIELFAEMWQTPGQPLERPVHTLNKFCKIYINGFDGAKELREQLMSATSPDELLQLVKNISLSAPE